MNLLALMAAIVFVPMDDRPVTARLPVMLGQIAGVRVEAPPRELLGRFIDSGKPDPLIAWLNQAPARENPYAFVISSDMLAYGGLVASRVPGASYVDAVTRLGELTHVRARNPSSWIGAFGTVMRLAPTGVPADTQFFAASTWPYLQQYANLHDPLLPSEVATAQHLRQLIGDATLDAYLATRGRNLAVDRLLLKMTAQGTIDRLVLGQDDAGPVGLHVPEVQLLQSDLAALGLIGRASIEPGADELGMALVAHAIARNAKWTPRIAVRYSTPDGASYQDPIEYAPVATAIDALIALSGGVRDDSNPEITLFVRVPGTTGAQDDASLAAISSEAAQRRSVALADLSYLKSYDDQAQFARELLSSGTASKLDAYSSWNTNANTVGTALAEAIAAGAGRRTHTYNALAHRTFTLLRFVDDYAYHDLVRPRLNETLVAQGIADHTLLTPGVTASMTELDRSLLWNDAVEILAQLDPGYHIAAVTIDLPWSRTFETSFNVAIAPNI